ncbi:Actin-binding transcription modulator [Balamuthia mandrillaris]
MEAATTQTEQRAEAGTKRGIGGVIDRYYKQYYAVDVNGKERHDQYIYKHSNHMCVVGVAPTHPCLQEGRTVVAVNFKPGKQDHASVKVVGKTKRGGHWLEPSGQLCELTCDDGTTYTVHACVRARLLEINERLKTTPSLVSTHPSKEGYIAILVPKFAEYGKVCAGLLSAEQWRKLRTGDGQECKGVPTEEELHQRQNLAVLKEETLREWNRKESLAEEWELVDDGISFRYGEEGEERMEEEKEES